MLPSLFFFQVLDIITHNVSRPTARGRGPEALNQPSPDTTPVMALPPRVPPGKAPKRKPSHAQRASSGPRKLEDDTWLNDSTSNRSLGRVLKVISCSNGTLIVTDNCRVRVDESLVARQGRDSSRRSVYAHQMSIDDMPID